MFGPKHFTDNIDATIKRANDLKKPVDKPAFTCPIISFFKTPLGMLTGGGIVAGIIIYLTR